MGSRQRQEGDFMFYRKNLPGWERAARVMPASVGRKLPSV